MYTTIQQFFIFIRSLLAVPVSRIYLIPGQDIVLLTLKFVTCSVRAVLYNQDLAKMSQETQCHCSS